MTTLEGPGEGSQAPPYEGLREGLREGVREGVREGLRAVLWAAKRKKYNGLAPRELRNLENTMVWRLEGPETL